MNQRQPFSSVASSSAIHMPSTRPRGSVYRKEASWWGVTAQVCPGVRSRSLCPVPPHRGRMSRSLVSWSPPGPASPRSVRNTPLPGPGREGAPQGLGEVARTTPCLAGLRGGFHAGKSSGQSQTLAWLPASCPRWGPQFLSRDPQPPAPESLVVQGGDAGAQPGCKGSKHRHGGVLPSPPPLLGSRVSS